mmetsp:Transcript_45355/g.75641  ORF Transcript_45355/g.75641 Transcript_45355/m.75641 type:complete len:289 (+) Transcript_45355:2600-3466(+)
MAMMTPTRPEVARKPSKPLSMNSWKLGCMPYSSRWGCRRRMLSSFWRPAATRMCWYTCSEGCSLKPKFLEFVIRSVERDPTLASNPLVGALLNLITASCASISAPWSYISKMPELPTTAHDLKIMLPKGSSSGSALRRLRVTSASLMTCELDCPGFFVAQMDDSLWRFLEVMAKSLSAYGWLKFSITFGFWNLTTVSQNLPLHSDAQMQSPSKVHMPCQWHASQVSVPRSASEPAEIASYFMRSSCSCRFLSTSSRSFTARSIERSRLGISTMPVASRFPFPLLGRGV